MISKLSERLYWDCYDILRGDSRADGRQRHSLGGGTELATLLVWNVLIACIVNVVGGLVAASLWDSRRLSAWRKRVGEIGTATDEISMDELQDKIDRLDRLLGSFEIEITSVEPRFEATRAEATDAVCELLCKDGYDPDTSKRIAQQIVDVVTERLKDR